MNRSKRTSKGKFLARNLAKGVVWLVVLIVVFLIIKNNFDLHPESWIGRIADQPFLVYLIFLISEIVVGIIPPEIFMFWSLKSADSSLYLVDIILLSTISYGAGLIGYFIGKTFYDTRIYEFLQDRLLGKYETFLRKFGGFLIIVAALTPLPFSGICILVGSVKFNYKKFMLFSSFRFLRFFAYGYIVWQANLL